MENSKKTVLHGWHIENGANMALFGNYDMPLWYTSGAKAEHLAVIQAAGIFDTSHMASIRLEGEGARELLQYCFSKDLDKCIGKAKGPLVNGRCVYGIFLQPNGHVIDDAIVSQLKDNLYMVVVNAAMGGEISSQLKKNAGNLKVEVEDLTDQVGKMDIQGPASAKVLARIVKDPEKLFEKMIYFSFKGSFGSCQGESSVQLIDGTELMVSRTGYTGEVGFELFVTVDKLGALWAQLLAAGKDDGVLPCGLASRDSLRAGSALPLSHQDVGDWPFLNNPWQFALSWEADGRGFSKEFIGSEQLLKSNWAKYTLPFAGFDPRKIGADEKNYVISSDGERIGTILTCTTDMAIGRVDGEIVSIAGNPEFKAKGLSCGFVLLDRQCKAGDIVLLTDGKRKIKVEIRADVRPGRTARMSLAGVLQ